MTRILPGPALAALLAAAIILAAAASAQRPHSAGAASAAVSIADFAFSPGTVTVGVGDTVTWTNNDAGIPHTVSSDSGSELASGQLAGGASYQKTFSAAGTFAYHCDIHPSMTGQVVVTGAAATATSTIAPTNTPTPAATATATTTTAATATATSQAPATSTPTAAATSAATSSPSSGTTPIATPTRAPGPPATGGGDSDGGDTATAVTSGIVAIAIVLAVGAAVYLVRRRRA